MPVVRPGDNIWPESQAYVASLPPAPGFATAYRDEEGWSHLEPVLAPPIENPLLATFTAAWFKIFLAGDKGEFYDLIFSSNNNSMCGHAAQVECWANSTTTPK